MPASLNRVMLIGNLGKDPDIKSLQDGTKIANLSIATAERWKDKNSGEYKEKTEWHRVTIWGPLADVAEKYLHKGSPCYVSGQLETRKWTDQSGQDRYSTEVVVRGYRAELLLLGKPDGNPTHNAERGQGTHDRARAADLDDEIPF